MKRSKLAQKQVDTNEMRESGRMKKIISLVWLLLACGSPTIAQKVPRVSIWDGVFSKAQAQRGEAVYQARCAVCHGQDLIADIESPSLTGPRFNFDWVGKTINDRFQRIRSTMPETSPGSLDDQTNLDVVAFILQFNDYPAGEQELGVDVGVLKQIVIEPRREKAR